MAWSTYSIVDLDEGVVDSNDVDQAVAEAVQSNLLEKPIQRSSSKLLLTRYGRPAITR